MEVSQATLDALEYPSLLRLIAELAATDVGRSAALGLTPLGDAGQLDERRALYEEVRVLLVDGPLVRSLEADIEPLIVRLEDQGSLLDSHDVLQAAALLRMADSAAGRVTQGTDVASPHLEHLLSDLPDSGDWTRRVKRTLDARGRVRDNASPALKTLRKKVQETRQDLYGQLQQSVGRFGDHLSEETIPLHEGRLVLMLKSGARGQLDGLVHGRSGSGRSFYFEPIEAVSGNNRLRTAIDDETAERARLMAELIDGLRQVTPAVLVAAGRVGDLDLLQAVAAFADLSGARLADIAAEGELRLCEARHPLLEPSLADLRKRALGNAGHRDAMVPLDLELDEATRLLVITGPNAGGKTVALKTAGLLTLASQSALPVPCAKGTRLPRTHRLVATVGDEQDLLNERSTFSARLLRLQEAWEAAGPGSLVLLDELGSGTDPDEGSALATALLEELLRGGALTLVTTHLTRLAALALESSGAACAAMEFDPDSARPTYRLLPGAPGASEALALAQRLGLPSAWLERASATLDPEQRSLQRLLEELEETRKRLARELDRATSEQRSLAAARTAAETERDELLAERRKVARRLKSELNDFERRVRQRLRTAEEQIRQELAAGRRKGVVAQVAAEILEDAPVDITSEAEPETASGPIHVGGQVRHRGLGWEGRLEKLNRGRAEVSVAGKRMRCRENELVGVAATPSTLKVAQSRPTERRPAQPDVAAELKLLGLRVEEALRKLDRYLDQALMGGAREVRVVHGHGTGRLRDAVRQHLDVHLAVVSHRPGGEGEGGDGATVVALEA